MLLFGYYGFNQGLYFDFTYVLIIIAFILTAYASVKIKTVYSKYAKVGSANGYTGSEAARIFLKANSIYSVRIASVEGTLSDHFDPRSNIVRLSYDNFNGTSIAAVAVAAHECGHVLQYNDNYLPVKLRTAMVPVVNIASTLSWPLFFIGIIAGAFRFLVPTGILLFCFAVAFHIVTLPVEINASRRGMKLLKANNILQDNELKQAKKVLSAAALTYIAAAMASILQLLRLILIARRYTRDD